MCGSLLSPPGFLCVPDLLPYTSLCFHTTESIFADFGFCIPFYPAAKLSLFLGISLTSTCSEPILFNFGEVVRRCYTGEWMPLGILLYPSFVFLFLLLFSNKQLLPLPCTEQPLGGHHFLKYNVYSKRNSV